MNPVRRGRYLFLLGLGMYASVARAQAPGTFAATSNMTTARDRHTATLLLDGRVLIAGGENLPNSLTIAELYDPATGSFTATGNMTTARTGHTATLLPDGRVLIVGGWNGNSPLASAELYDPSAGTFTATGNMITTQPAFSISATLLTNGKVLTTGGVVQDVGVSSPELYDPSTGAFTLAGPYASVYPTYDFDSTATPLPNGRVLFAAEPLYTAHYGGELYDPAANTFSRTGAMVSDINGRTATLLTNGKVLLAGGEDEEARYQRAEIYDSNTGTFTATGDLTAARDVHVAVLLPDGTPLITGGEGWGSIGDGPCCIFLGSLASAELYNSSTGTFTTTGSMTARRELHTATALNDGRVLITGGLYYAGIGLLYGSLASAEIYTPSVLVPAPALFSLSGDGRGQGAIWHAETGQIASSLNPVVAGEILAMYTTSLGNGSVIPPQVAVGGRLGEILYFGGAPGYPGYNQVNFRVPSGVAPGSAVPVRLTYLGRPSNEVTIGVQ